MRRYHRWLMTVVMVLMTYWSVSGLTLAIYDFTDKNQTWAFDGGGVGAPGSNTDTPQLPPTKLATLLLSSVKFARAIDPGAPLTAAALRMQDGNVLGVVDFGGATPRELVLDPTSGKLFADTPPKDQLNELHSRIKSWHRGNVIGTTGVWLALLTGLGLLGLIVTGTILYGTMLAARIRLGRRALFWR